jgi:hypothetical protein
LINKSLQALPEWQAVGNRRKSDFYALFPKVIHIFFHKERGRRKRLFSYQVRIFSGALKAIFTVAQKPD